MSACTRTHLWGHIYKDTYKDTYQRQHGTLHLPGAGSCAPGTVGGGGWHICRPFHHQQPAASHVAPGGAQQAKRLMRRDWLHSVLLRNDPRRETGCVRARVRGQRRGNRTDAMDCTWVHAPASFPTHFRGDDHCMVLRQADAREMGACKREGGARPAGGSV